MNNKLINLAVLILVGLLSMNNAAANESEDTSKRNAVDAITCFFVNDIAQAVVTDKIDGANKYEEMEYLTEHYPEPLTSVVESVVKSIYSDESISAESSVEKIATTPIIYFARCLVEANLLKYKKKLFDCTAYTEITQEIYRLKENGINIEEAREKFDSSLTKSGFTSDVVGKVYSSKINKEEFKINIWQECGKTYDQPFQFL